MKKILLLLATVLTGVGAWAQEQQPTPALTYTNITSIKELSAEDATVIRAMEAMTVVADVEITNSSNLSLLFTAVADYTSNKTDNNTIWSLGIGGNSMRYVVGARDGGWYSTNNGDVKTTTKKVVYVYNGGKIRFYADGAYLGKEFSATAALDSFDGENAKFYLGGMFHNTSTEYGNFNVNGTIKSISFYNVALTAEQIEKLSPASVLNRASANIKKYQIGTGVGKYTSSDAEFATKLAAIEAFDASNATTEEIMAEVDKVNALIATLNLNMPEAGKFYRIKAVAGHNDDAPYLSSVNSTVKDKTTRAAFVKNADATTIFYFDGNQLVSYGSGNYLVDNSNFLGYNGVQSAGTKIVFKPATSEGIGEYNVMLKNGDRSLFTHTGNYADGAGKDVPADNKGYCFNIVEVEWLPILVNEEIRYSTFYSPVELENFQNRFKIYTVVVNGNRAVLTEQPVVPANTAVVLHLQDGAEVENSYCFLKVKSTELEVESELAGTFASKYVTEESYVLAKPEGKELAFYLAKMNESNEPAFLNNGFKGYLPKPASSTARSLSFDFGTETAIESIESVEVKDAVVYDLAGRRVQGAQKGIFIVNGKKVIK